jgi:hypothetical protein
MEIKLFGRQLFSARTSRADQLLQLASDSNKSASFLPDFYRANSSGSGELSAWISTSSGIAIQEMTNSITSSDAKKKRAKKIEPKVEEKKLTPKEIHELKFLHDMTFKLNTDPEYVDSQLSDFRDKLAILEAGDWDMRNGVNEISSVIARFENRKKYASVKDFFEEFPYTTTTRINELVKKHNHLQLGTVAQFVADMPKEASDVMKKYNESIDKLCGKKGVYYIIADKKDFHKTQARRDPILLAQSPFGHVWQILGAWDKEMLLIDEL